MIRVATAADIDSLADIHISALPDDFLPRLGRGFLRNIFFPRAVSSPNALTLVHEEERRVLAFVVFAFRGGAFTAELKRARTAILSSLLRRGWRDVGVLLQALALVRGGKIQVTRPMDRIEGLPELYLMATAPGRQGMGIGKSLVREGMRLLADKGCKICIVKTSSDRAEAFYRSVGFECAGSEIRAGRTLSLLARCTA